MIFVDIKLYFSNFFFFLIEKVTDKNKISGGVYFSNCLEEDLTRGSGVCQNTIK